MTDVPHESVLHKSCTSRIESSLKSGRGQVLQLKLDDGRDVTVSTAGLPACVSGSEPLHVANVTCNTGPGQLVYHPESQQWHLLWRVDVQEIRRQHVQQDYRQKAARMNEFLRIELEKIADEFDWYEK